MTTEQGAEGPTHDVSVGVAAWTGDDPDVASRQEQRTRRRGGSADGRSGSRSRLGRRPADEVEDGPPADPESVARTILLDQLTGRARTRSELADKLASRNVPDDVAATLLDRFTEVGLIDDEAFARSWVETRTAGRGLARRALRHELTRKGVEKQIVDEVLEEVDPDDEEEGARTLVRRKLRSVAGLPGDKATRRLVGMLARKGYPAGLAYRVVAEELRGVVEAAEAERLGMDELPEG